MIAPTPEIDVDQLMAEIREQVMRARAENAVVPAGREPVAASSEAGWFAVRDHLHVAEQHAAVGVEVPPFARYRGPKRALARAVARVVLFLTQVLSLPQRTYNGATLGALRMLAERVRALEDEIAALRAAGRPRGEAARREVGRESDAA